MVAAAPFPSSIIDAWSMPLMTRWTLSVDKVAKASCFAAQVVVTSQLGRQDDQRLVGEVTQRCRLLDRGVRPGVFLDPGAEMACSRHTGSGLASRLP